MIVDFCFWYANIIINSETNGVFAKFFLSNSINELDEKHGFGFSISRKILPVKWCKNLLFRLKADGFLWHFKCLE